MDAIFTEEATTIIPSGLSNPFLNPYLNDLQDHRKKLMLLVIVGDARAWVHVHSIFILDSTPVECIS